MSEHETVCPRCGNTLVDSGHQPLPTFCTSCGFIPEKNEVDAKLERSNLRFVIGFSVVMVIAFIQVAVWGNHAIEIRWLQLADKTGLASVEQLERMAKICVELKKRDCVEYAYLRQSQIDKRNAVRLAEFQISRGKHQEAVKTLKAYVATNKQDMRAYMVYAGALTETGRYDEAVKYYEYMISKSQGLPTEAARNYVKCLARAKRYAQAEKVIYKIRNTYPGTQKFMDGELRVLAGLKSVRTDSKIR
jgi:tetratricopeptide (TPR) repeat protein